ncbi:MAG: HAMP domain-containing protein, partial [Acidobacteriota bacterium]
FRWGKRRLLWKVRNKIIVSFAFVGIIPLIILLIIASTVLIIILKQVSGFYLEHELGVITETLDTAGRTALLDYLRPGDHSVAAARSAAEDGLRGLPFGLRHAAFLIYRTQHGSEEYRWIDTVVDPDNSPPLPPPMPAWVRDGYSGFTRDDQKVSFTDVVDLDSRTRLIIQLPFDQRTIDYLKRRTSLEVLLTRAPRENPSFQQAYASLGDAQQGFSIHWANPFKPIAWDTGQADELWSIALSVPLRTLLDYFFDQGTGPLIVLLVLLGVLFVAVEFISLVIGVAIARGITQSIHDIYSAVLSIQAGDFSVRIPSRRKDQLDNVAESLNEMSTSIVQLMGEIAKRESIEKELEIAKEVQIQLFPQQVPALSPLQIAASCSPARQVSGDYYDFLAHGSEHLDIVVGDISGKGISAALLMASLQATIRSGLGELNGDLGFRGRGGHASTRGSAALLHRRGRRSGQQRRRAVRNRPGHGNHPQQPLPHGRRHPAAAARPGFRMDRRRGPGGRHHGRLHKSWIDCPAARTKPRGANSQIRNARICRGSKPDCSLGFGSPWDLVPSEWRHSLGFTKRNP